MSEFKTDIVGVPIEGVMYVHDGARYFTYDFGHHGVRYPGFNSTFVKMCMGEGYIFGSLKFVKQATIVRIREQLAELHQHMDDLSRSIAAVDQLTPEIVDRMERDHNSAQFN